MCVLLQVGSATWPASAALSPVEHKSRSVSNVSARLENTRRLTSFVTPRAKASRPVMSDGAHISTQNVNADGSTSVQSMTGPANIHVRTPFLLEPGAQMSRTDRREDPDRPASSASSAPVDSSDMPSYKRPLRSTAARSVSAASPHASPPIPAPPPSQLPPWLPPPPPSLPSA